MYTVLTIYWGANERRVFSGWHFLCDLMRGGAKGRRLGLLFVCLFVFFFFLCVCVCLRALFVFVRFSLLVSIGVHT